MTSMMHDGNMLLMGARRMLGCRGGRGWACAVIATTGVSPELMVIAVGSGSVIFSHVNDPGFWLFKEYFNLTIGETIKSWSMLETIISVCGLVGCLLLNMVI
ncbi:hypothetical protein ECZU34_27550 [Escherichia coli]|nr:hypothetical protein ECZU34_27550 [Escherichia coli]